MELKTVLNALVAPAIAIGTYIVVQMFGDRISEFVPLDRWMANVIIGLATIGVSAYFLSGWMKMIGFAAGLAFALTGVLEYVTPHSPSPFLRSIGGGGDRIEYRNWQGVMR